MRKSMSFYDERHTHEWPICIALERNSENKTTKQQSIEPVFSLRDLSPNTKLLFSVFFFSFTSFWAISHKFSIAKRLMPVQQHNSLWTSNYFAFIFNFFTLFSSMNSFFFNQSLPFYCSEKMIFFLLLLLPLLVSSVSFATTHSSYLTAPLIEFDVQLVPFSYICHLDMCCGVGVAAYMIFFSENDS